MRAAEAVAQIVERIETRIAEGTWQPGFRLPTERELEEEFGVARNTLRKGLKTLEDQGKIVRHIGRGSFVAEARPQMVSDAQALLDRVIGSSPAEVMEVRLVLEPWAASLSATRATSADLAAMRECFERAEASVDIPEFEIWDGRLHEVIIASAKNELLSGLYEAINMARHQPEWMKLKERTVTPDRRQTYQKQHGAIVEALGERDAAKAADLIKAHLLAVRMSLVGH
ncbi:FCD domain-containing protein [Sphingobium sp. SA2]|uniref:FadR/GntR family transcriptional regulator n=1 Tax=Sphingobium sp. SA2 TaxID=1524832 RepID=UPI0028C03792|nr:FCD domain-containing protein [Sphingobium sp. SA2]MDT7532029.1 FCD domain-containing protein [Sphingobium sp. SA2]